ncbi:hypothetical protein OG897_36335 [Streptomyces sp. NBC_00237]|uniref:hypothetical protein n=1 Tax=Streptomyces sp. NBC_00237 TaxID=2975687 RepID=UPI002254A60F|nr:hypothetical protein [Streptomyces sp. NBC_00237]MCX5206856.1 hypothetical protein [Streptomyces sp. NBC_00237]
MAHQDPERPPGPAGPQDPPEPEADPRGALGDEPAPRAAAAPASGHTGRSHGTASHAPGVVGTLDPQSEG